MAWGARSNFGIDDLVARVASDEPDLTALALLPSRRFGTIEAASLAGALRGNTSIAELHLGGRAMSAESASLLAEALIERTREKAACSAAAASALRELSVGDASFGCVGAAALAPLLSHAGALCGELDLEYRGIGVEGARALAGAVVEARRRRRRATSSTGGVGVGGAFLQSLNLARNPSLGEQGACEALSAALFDEVEEETGVGDEATILTSLDLSGCALSSSGVAALVREREGDASSSPSSQSSPSPLLSLRLDRNPGLDPLAARALGRALAGGGRGRGRGGLSKLRRLSLSGCPLLGDAAAEALSLALLGATATAPAPAKPTAAAAPAASLRSLDLSGCGVGPSGAKHLAAALKSEHCRLTKLKLSGSGSEEQESRESDNGAASRGAATLGDEGALALACALAEASSFSSLADLDLSSCGISSGEAAAALLGPAAAASLEALTLAGNPLGDAGASAVAAALLLRRGESDDRLEHLDLAACGIGLEGAAALADALLLSTTTTEGEEEEEDKKEGKKFAAPSLRTLVLGGNPATEEDAFAERVVSRLRETRPELDVAWRSGDQHAAASERK